MGLEIFDLKDRKILYQLDMNCRQSNSEIGKKVGLSKQVVDYRIKRLVKDGHITRFATVIDTYRLGISNYKIYIQLENADKEKFSEIIGYLKSQKTTQWIATCSGKWDLIAGYLVKDIYEFNDALKELDEMYSNFIANREMTATIGVPHWRKDYLLENVQRAPVVFQGGLKETKTLDELDEEIIKILVNNARMSVVDIAKILKTTPRVVKYRIERLRKEKIILISRFFLNLEKLNYIYCKAIIKFKNLNEARYESFFARCSRFRNLTYIINCIGSWDIELDFEIQDFNTFHKIMLDIRDNFSDIIKSYDFAIAINEDKLDYYPGAYPVTKDKE